MGSQRVSGVETIPAIDFRDQLQIERQVVRWEGEGVSAPMVLALAVYSEGALGLAQHAQTIGAGPLPGPNGDGLGSTIGFAAYWRITLGLGGSLRVFFADLESGTFQVPSCEMMQVEAVFQQTEPESTGEFRTTLQAAACDGYEGEHARKWVFTTMNGWEIPTNGAENLVSLQWALPPFAHSWRPGMFGVPPRLGGAGGVWHMPAEAMSVASQVATVNASQIARYAPPRVSASVRTQVLWANAGAPVPDVRPYVQFEIRP